MTTLTPDFPHLAIRASAGTGKTFQLTNRFIGLLAAGESSSRILATTFTRKAAGEILDRVLHRLAEAALDPRKCRELATHAGADGLDPARAMELLGELSRGLHRLQMCTLDSFFASIATTFSMELGLPTGWRIVEPVVDQQLRNEAIRAVLDEQDPGQLVTLMRLLNRDHAARPVSRRIGELVGNLYRLYLETPAEAWRALPRSPGLSPDLLRAATDRLAGAADEFSLNKSGTPDKRWKTAHGKTVEAARLHLWEEVLCLGIGGKIAIGEDRYYGKPIPPAVVEAYHPILQHARAAVMTDLAKRTEAMHGLLERFDAQFTRLKMARHALRFEDVTRALAEGPVMGRLEEIYYRLDARIAHLLLDEFQDTSAVQWRVLGPLAEEIAAHADGERSLFCVGDVKQAIYGWRGGEAGIFDTLGSQLPSVRWEPLNKSFRSAQPIIDTVNMVFEDIENNLTLEKHLSAAEAWAEGFERHTTNRADLPGYARMEVAPRPGAGAGVGVEEDQERVTLRHAARRIREIVQAAPGCTVGVLLRKNNRGQIARLIYELGREDDEGALPGGLPKVLASEEGGNPLTDSPAVMVALSLLKLADHPGDSAARFHVATSPLGPAVGLTRFDHDPGTRAKANAEARRVAFEVRAALLGEGYGPVLHRWTEHLAEHCDAHDLTRLMQLVELAHRYDGEATLRPADFVRFVESQRVEDSTAANVRVMTIHRAKGLQFDVVVLPQLDEDLTGQTATAVVEKPADSLEAARVCAYVNKDLVKAMPVLGPMFDQHAVGVVRESLSVLYVALTRAVHAMHIIVGPSKANEKSVPATFTGILRGALTDCSPLDPDDPVVFEHGDERWFEGVEQYGASACETTAEPPKPRLAPSDGRWRGLPRRSPSNLEGGSRIDLARRMQLGTNRALGYGSAIHAMFERVEWLDEMDLSEEALRAMVGRASGRGVDAEAVVKQFREMVDRPAIGGALRRAAYPAGADLAVLREERFVVRVEDAVLSGTLDRLVLTMRDEEPIAAEVIDFKTDALDGKDGAAVDRAVAFYRPQIEAYRKAVRRMYGLKGEAVRGKLLFVSAGVARGA